MYRLQACLLPQDPDWQGMPALYFPQYFPMSDLEASPRSLLGAPDLSDLSDRPLLSLLDLLSNSLDLLLVLDPEPLWSSWSSLELESKDR